MESYDLTKAPEVHFCNDNSEYAYVVDSTVDTNSKTITAKVPNKLLEESLPLHCYIYLTDSEDETSMKTILHVELPVNKRKKPDDYHYEDDSEVISLRDKIKEIESSLDDYVLKSGSSKNLIHGTVLSNKSCTADGDASISGGNGCAAYGRGSIALGSNSSATNDCSVAIGGACTAKGSASVAMGGGCTSTDGQSVALGASSAYMSSSFAAGGGCRTGVLPTSDNQSPNSGKNGAVAIGASCYAEGSGSIAIGTANKAICDWSTAIGVGSIADAPQSVVIGGRSSSLKPNTAKTATNSVVIGSSYAYSPYSFAFGENCTVGFESTDDTQSVTQKEFCYVLGNSSAATGNLSFAMGGSCSAFGDYSFAMGTGCTVNEGSWNSVAMGSGAIVDSNVSTSFVFGGGSYIHASNSIALGSGVSIYSRESVAIGCGCIAGDETKNIDHQNASSFCFGFVCTSKGGSGSVATGYKTISSSPSQFVTGKYNLEDIYNKYGFILGNGNYDTETKTTTRSNAIAIDWQGKIYVNGSSTGVDVLDLLNRIKALEEALDGLKLKKTTTSEYNSLSEKDTNTVYLCTDN